MFGGAHMLLLVLFALTMVYYHKCVPMRGRRSSDYNKDAIAFSVLLSMLLYALWAASGLGIC